MYALQNSRLACFGEVLQEIDLENRKTGRKRPRLLENRRKLGQIDEKNTRNLKKALPGRENGARIEFFRILGQNVKIAEQARKINPKVLPKFANFCRFLHFLQKSAKISENRQTSAKKTLRNMHVPHPNMTTP